MKMSRDRVLGLVLILVTVFVGFQIAKNNGDILEKIFGNYKNSEIVQKINREISNPGALVAEIESLRAYLTKDGVFNLTNLERQSRGMVLFSGDKDLDQIARMRLEDMFAKGYFEHVSPSGESASSVADDIGYEYISIGENIALGNFETDQVLVQAWMDSPGHRANILNQKFTNLGIAVAKGTYKGRETWIGVQIFSRPLSKCPSVDESLKTKIDASINQAELIKQEIERIQRELDEMYGGRRQNRDEYNAKVEEYNSLVRLFNEKNMEIKQMIETYNQGVKNFNSCLGE